ncbi:hypothetical protein MZM54_02310 [[Brevibacterium] frigoritolerans]|nr:hypothetical protein [Peribacillus frigoritolerans]
MNTNVLFIYPVDKGLKSYIKVDDKFYFITFLTEKNNAEFTVYSEDQSDVLLKDSKDRQELLNSFVRFLKQHKEEIKVGVYLNETDEMFNEIFRLHKLEKGEKGIVNASFSILEQKFTISNLRTIKNRQQIIFDQTYALFKHEAADCFCENIKHKHDINDFEHCLVLIEHQDIILNWIEKEYRKKFLVRKHNNIYQFPTN